ncbi:MAG TPA: 3-oxoacyl-ACP reductase [Lachnospiraceae bacterium]|nr:3-oxoacyl-ACP reductase [Lachnospiraceae bacterium]
MHQKTILITGASRGIGRAAAICFAEHGYHVFLNAAHSVRALSETAHQIQTLGSGSCELVPGDVGNPVEVRKIFSQIQDSRKGLDVLINNAGISYIGLLTDMTDDEWNRILSVNLSSAFYCCRSAIPYMVSRKSGKIINVSSMWGTSGASCEAAYSASKAGLHGLTKALAKELAPSGIQVNAAAFGVIDTSMNVRLDPEERAALADEIPAGYFASAKEAAEFLYQMAGMPDYMTGQIIGFDGGFL